jgi:ABC-type glycerol-3-phosphate transport system substrate-binding protein
VEYRPELHQDAVFEAIDGVASGRLSRRQFMERAAVLGLSASAIGSILANRAFAGTRGGESAGAFDPMAYKGATVKIIVTGGEKDERGLQDKKGEIKKRFGINLDVTALQLGPLIEKEIANEKAKQSAYDIIEVLGFLVPGQVGPGYFERLNPYLSNPSKTPANFNLHDFPIDALNNTGYFNLKTKQYGHSKDLYLLPGIHSGSVIYFYRKDLFKKAGLKPAKTWADYMRAAKKLNSGDVAGSSMVGANDFSLATVDWFTRFLTIGGKLTSGSPKTKNFTPHVNSKQGVQALQMLIDLLPYSPKNVTSYGFNEETDAFATGKVAQMVLWSTIAGPVFNPKTSKVADKVGVDLVPANPGQKHTAIRGGWGLGIPKNISQERKDAAWRVMTYICSPEFDQYQTLTYNSDPNRSSTYVNPRMVKALPYLPVAGKAQNNATIIDTSQIPEFFSLNDTMNREFNAALLKQQSAKEACDKVNAAWTKVFKSSGYLK